MRKTIKGFILLTATIFCTTHVQAQDAPVIKDTITPYVQPVNLSGPRIGFSFIDGINPHPLFEVFSDGEKEFSPFTTLFGWQFEHRYFTAPDGSAGLIEFIPMVAGFEQGRVIPLANLIVGYRTASGFEIGVGPQVNPLGSGVVFAMGNNYKTAYVNFPVNLAVVVGKETLRIGITCGFNVRNAKSNSFSIF